MKVRATRPHPVMDFIGGLFQPVVSMWNFMGTLPTLIYIGVALCVAGVALCAAMVVIAFLRLFKRS